MTDHTPLTVADLDLIERSTGPTAFVQLWGNDLIRLVAMARRVEGLETMFLEWRDSHSHYPGVARCSACREFRDQVNAALAPAQEATDVQS